VSGVLKKGNIGGAGSRTSRSVSERYCGIEVLWKRIDMEEDDCERVKGAKKPCLLSQAANFGFEAKYKQGALY
jgi:hypothetical protein